MCPISKHALNAFDSGLFNAFIDSLPVNGVRGVKPPSIAEEELEWLREAE